MKFEGTWVGLGTVLTRDVTVNPSSVTTVDAEYLVEIGKFTKKCYIIKIIENNTNTYFSTVYALEENIARGEFSVPNGFGNLTFIQKTDKKARLGLSTVSNTDEGLVNTAVSIKLCRKCAC